MKQLYETEQITYQWRTDFLCMKRREAYVLFSSSLTIGATSPKCTEYHRVQDTSAIIKGLLVSDFKASCDEQSKIIIYTVNMQQLAMSDYKNTSINVSTQCFKHTYLSFIATQFVSSMYGRIHFSATVSMEDLFCLVSITSLIQGIPHKGIGIQRFASASLNLRCPLQCQFTKIH